jgi:trehalose 6-phosphate phosphatase
VSLTGANPRTIGSRTAGDLASLALFLDIDGTLLEIAQTPRSVIVDPELKELLTALATRTNGAVALVSGRRIAEMDALFLPLTLSAAGLHGFERRSASGSHHLCRLPTTAALEEARRAMLEFANRHSGVLVEDKCFALAMHYRLAPDLQQQVAAAMTRIAAQVRPQFELQMGKMVAELRPAGATKGLAVREFMSEQPFRGRYPVYIGDDLTDESAFEWVNGAGGLSIAVDVPGATAAQAQLPDVAAVRTWLAGLLT